MFKINFRYQTEFNFTIVYNLNLSLPICDGFRNCSCISSMLSHQSIYCAKKFYILDSTVNNLVEINLLIQNQTNNKSIYLIEELSKRNDYELISKYKDKSLVKNR